MNPVEEILEKVGSLRINVPDERTSDSNVITSVAGRILRELGLSGTVSVTKRYPACIEYIFWLDNQQVTSYKVFAKDGRMRIGNVLLCVEDVIIEALSREHPELSNDIEETLRAVPSPFRWDVLQTKKKG